MPQWTALHTGDTARRRDQTDLVARAQVARRRAAAAAGYEIDPWGPPPTSDANWDRDDSQAGYQTQVLTVDPKSGKLRDGVGRLKQRNWRFP